MSVQPAERAFSHNPLGAAQHTRDALAGERTLREVMMAAGFQGLRRAAETPFNLVLEARP
jgi:hypothetical protein